MYIIFSWQMRDLKSSRKIAKKVILSQFRVMLTLILKKKGKSQSKILSKKGHMTDFAGSWLTKSFKIAEKVALNPVSNRINFEFGFLNPVFIPVFYLPAPAGIRWFFQILI